jgi:hypothetical protein
MLTAFTLAALNLAIRLPRFRRPVWASICIGFLFTLMMLTKTTALFLLPALGWAVVLPLWQNCRLALRCALAAVGVFAVTFGAWMTLIFSLGLLPDYKYLFFVNKYPKPPEFYWPVLSLWWSFHGGLWVDHILIPLAGIVVVGALLARRNALGRKLLLDPVFGASVLAVAGYILFMTYQNHPQPRYFAVVAFFSFFVVAQGAGVLLGPSAQAGTQSSSQPGQHNGMRYAETHPSATRMMGWGVIALAALAVGIDGAWTLNYAAHPEYTFVDAAERLTNYIDTHPNGKRLLVSVSGDQISLITHLPALCDDFGTPTPEMPDLVSKLDYYRPGWWATWNDIDPGTLEDLHSRYSLEQVASFHTLDDPQRNDLVLFKLHPLPGGQTRGPDDQNLQVPLPGDKIDIPIQ